MAASSQSLRDEQAGQLLPEAGVTVVVPTFNRARYIAECIDSLLSQTVAPAAILVVDDGSTDGTAAVVERYGNSIRYIAKPNGGKSSALNLAIPLVETEHVWFFDDDDVAHPWAIESHLARQTADPTLGFTFGFHEWGADAADGRITITRRPTPPAIFDASCEAQRVNALKYCAFMLSGCISRTALVHMVGAFDTRLKRSQDYDYIVRMTQSARFAYTGGSTYVIREHEGLRGPADALHKSSDKRKTWIQYDGIC
jgi:glycosyltransferase involved in cell wall biosynthesis